jgi:hypothetical protein
MLEKEREEVGKVIEILNDIEFTMDLIILRFIEPKNKEVFQNIISNT